MLTNVTQNPIQAIIDSNYLGVLFWAVLLGFGIADTYGSNERSYRSDFSRIVTGGSIDYFFRPQSVFWGLVYESIATTGLSGLTEYLQLVLVLVGTMLFVALVIYPLLTFCLSKKILSIDFLLFKKESAISAFFTRSSAANIPINMMLAEKLKLTKESYAISDSIRSNDQYGGAAVTITVMTLTTVQALGIEASFGFEIDFKHLGGFSCLWCIWSSWWFITVDSF